MTQRRLFDRPRRRPGPATALVGIMTSSALLIAWWGVRLFGGAGLGPESLLLEFLTVFLVLLGTMLVAARVTGILPGRAGHVRKR